MNDSSHPASSAPSVRFGVAGGRAVATQLARIGQAVEAAHDGIGVVDLEGRVVYMNPALRDLTGYSVDTLEADGGPIHLFVNAGTARAAFLWAIRDGSWLGEVEMRERSGEARTVLLRVSMIRDGCGRALGLVGVHTDMTEQKRTEGALKRSEARHRALLEAIPDLIVLFSTDGTIRDVEAARSRAFPLGEPTVGYALRDAFPARIGRSAGRSGRRPERGGPVYLSLHERG